jgi:transcriptional regulator with XRE-family HTH domain
MNFGQRLQAIRDAKGLTLPELSKRSLLGVATLFRYQQLENAGTIAYDALVRLASALEVDVRYLIGENQELSVLDPAAVASRESLRRFIDAASISPRQQRGLMRIQDDPAAPKTISGWKNFWRLVQCFRGKDPYREGDATSNEPRLQVVGPPTQLKSSGRAKHRGLRHVA